MSTDAVKGDFTAPADSHGAHELASRRDSHRHLPDSTAISNETRSDSASEEVLPAVVSKDLCNDALLHSSLDPKPVPVPVPTQAQHRNTGLLPTFLARISSITSRGTGLASPVPTDSSNRPARRAVLHKTPNHSTGIESKTRPSNQDTRAAQAPSLSPSPSHSGDPSTTPATVRDYKDAQSSSDNNPYRQRARRASSASFVSSLDPSGTVDPPVGKERKMHQTSSRLLRMTDDDRPFTRVRPSHFSV